MTANELQRPSFVPSWPLLSQVHGHIQSKTVREPSIMFEQPRDLQLGCTHRGPMLIAGIATCRITTSFSKYQARTPNPLDVSPKTHQGHTCQLWEAAGSNTRDTKCRPPSHNPQAEHLNKAPCAWQNAAASPCDHACPLQYTSNVQSATRANTRQPLQPLRPSGLQHTAVVAVPYRAAVLLLQFGQHRC
jgi:hypothetical protein